MSEPAAVIQTFDQIRAKVAAAASAPARPATDNKTRPQKPKREKKPKEPTTLQDVQNQQPPASEKTKRPSSGKKLKQSQPPAPQVVKEVTEPKAKKQPVKKSKAKPLPEPKTKVVVRRLPPNLPEKIFWDSVKDWVEENTVDWRVYVPGKPAKSRGKVGSFGRAYLHFTALEHVMAFHRAYDGHLFVDSKGNENRAVVEFAPYQIVPKEPRKPDARQGTIQEDRDYLAFLEFLKDDGKTANGEAHEAETAIEQPSMKDGKISTPLLDELREKKAAELAAHQRNQQINKPHTLLNNSAPTRSRGNVSLSRKDNGTQNLSPKSSARASPPSGKPSRPSSSNQISKSNPSTNIVQAESSKGRKDGGTKKTKIKKEGENVSAKSSPPASTGSVAKNEKRNNEQKAAPTTTQAPKTKKLPAERPSPVIMRRERPAEGNTPAPAEPVKQTGGSTAKQPTKGPNREQVQPNNRPTRGNSSKAQARPLPEQHKNKIRNLLQHPLGSRNKEEKSDGQIRRDGSNRASNSNVGNE